MSLSYENDDSELSVFWNYLTISQLKRLKVFFTLNDEGKECKNSNKSVTAMMWLDFIMKNNFEKIGEERAAMHYFNLIGRNSNRKYITWTELLNFLNFIMPVCKKKTLPLYHGGKYMKQHVKHEIVKKILCIRNGKTFVYIITSKHGCTGLYDEKFRIQKKYEIDIDNDPESDLSAASSDPGWITDVLWMESSKHIVYSTSLRTLHFYDASASTHYEEYRVYGLKSIPMCLEFVSSAAESSDMLLFGDDSGGVTVVKFFQSKSSLFLKDEVSSIQCLFWPDM